MISTLTSKQLEIAEEALKEYQGLYRIIPSMKVNYDDTFKVRVSSFKELLPNDPFLNGESKYNMLRFGSTDYSYLIVSPELNNKLEGLLKSQKEFCLVNTNPFELFALMDVHPMLSRVEAVAETQGCVMQKDGKGSEYAYKLAITVDHCEFIFMEKHLSAHWSLYRLEKDI